VNAATAISQDQYIIIIAEEALAKFMVNDLFANFVTSLIARAQAKVGGSGH
jgi:hypothetical protein